MTKRHRASSSPALSRPARPRRPAGSTAKAPPQPFIQRYRAGLLAGVILAILVAGAVIFTLKFGPSNTGKEQIAGAQPADPAVVAALAQIPATTFDAVGVGSVSGGLVAINGAPLTNSGKPEVVYIGAEYCPYCAAERWAMIVALSRFGSFSNLHTTRSSASDVFANTPTFTFYQSTYTSQYLNFEPVETMTNQPSGSGGYTALQSPNAQQQDLISTYDKAPYVPGGSGGTIPFVDFGGKYILSGATYNPGILANLTWSQIAAALGQPSSSQAKAIIGSANLLSVALCQITGQQPANVCQSPGVQKAAAAVKGA